MKNYGYMRVSSVDQNDERQFIELLKWGIEEKNIFADKVSGKDFNRPNYQLLRKKIKDGDVLVVKSIDRLGRNYEEILNEWRFLVREKKADIRYRPTASFLCGADGTGIYQAAPGRGHRPCQVKGRPHGAPSETDTGTF